MEIWNQVTWSDGILEFWSHRTMEPRGSGFLLQPWSLATGAGNPKEPCKFVKLMLRYGSLFVYNSCNNFTVCYNGFLHGSAHVVVGEWSVDPCKPGPLQVWNRELLKLEPWNPVTMETWNLTLETVNLPRWDPGNLKPWNHGTLWPCPVTLQPWNPRICCWVAKVGKQRFFFADIKWSSGGSTFVFKMSKECTKNPNANNNAKHNTSAQVVSKPNFPLFPNGHLFPAGFCLLSALPIVNKNIGELLGPSCQPNDSGASANVFMTQNVSNSCYIFQRRNYFVFQLCWIPFFVCCP